MELSRQRLNEISKEILDACYTVHLEMGPGLLESIYVQCLDYELGERNFKTSTEVLIPLKYKDKTISEKLRIDMLVEDHIIIEAKAVETILPVHEAQILSYLKLTNKSLGFLVNLNLAQIKDGIKGFVNNF